jgi:hypothetical protein
MLDRPGRERDSRARHPDPTLVRSAMRRYVALLLPACLLPPPNHLHGGETLYIAEDSLVLEVMGAGLHKEDHRHQAAGNALPVLPAGATVRVAADYEQRRALDAPNAPLADRNPWVLVDVVDSPAVAQRGWKGWIHLDTTKREPVAAASLGSITVVKPSVLCPWPDANEFQCRVNLRADTPLRVLGCSGARAEVELWTAQGLYIHGFVTTTQFSTAPCAVATKE